MIKKKKNFLNKIRLNLFLSLLKKKKNKKLIKLKNVNLKKNILIKKYSNIMNVLKYKKYKLLNLKLLQKKKKKFYINLYNNFYDVLIWALFIFSKKKFKFLYNTKFLKYKKKKFFNSKKFRKFKKKKKIFSYKLNELFLNNIFIYLYNISLLKYHDMFNKVLLNNLNYNKICNKYLQFLILKNFINIYNLYNQNFQTKDTLNKIHFSSNFIKSILIKLKKKNFSINISKLNKIYKKLQIIKQKNNYKIINSYKKKIYNQKKLLWQDKLFLKNKILKSNFYKSKFIKLKKKNWKILKKNKKKKIIKRRIRFYLKKIIRKKFLLNNKLNLRLFYYDFFFNKAEKNLLFLKKNSAIFLWKNILNKTYLRFRLSEYIFFSIVEFNESFFFTQKTYFLLNFYKIIVYLKKKLQQLKKYLLKKNILKKLIKNNRKYFKYFLKKEYLIQNLFSKNLGKVVNKYYSMLKYFNKIFYFLFKKLKFNVQKSVHKYNNFVYLSYIINLAINEENSISLVNLNDYFLQKTTKMFSDAWLINDNVFNYIIVYDKAFKKDLYWNNYTPITSLFDKNIERSYFITPAITKQINKKYLYFFGKKLNNMQYIYYLSNSYFYYFIFRSIFFFNYFNKSFNKFYLLNFLNINSFIFNFKFLSNKFSFYKNINFIIKWKLLSIYHNFLNKIILKKFNNYKKKIFIKKLILWFFFLIFKQKYNFVKLQYSTYFLLYIFFKIKVNFENANKVFMVNNNKLDFIKKKKIFKNLTVLQKNKYNFQIFFLNIYNNYYTKYSKYNKYNFKKCILHLVEKKTNNFLTLSLFDLRRVVGHTSAGQGLNRAYYNSKRQKKGTWLLGKILFRKLRLRARKFRLKEVFLKSNSFWNYRINFLTKYWVLRYKLGVPFLKGIKLGLGLPYHKGLRLSKRRRR